jgi:hypothetical protein
VPLFQATVEYRTSFALEAPSFDEARRMAQRIAINNLAQKAVIDVSVVPPTGTDSEQIH